jgi:2-oxoglutarate ferredoxin oxidoreductase subunit alpha
MRHLTDKIEHHVDDLTRYREYYTEDAETLLISYGSSARSALHVIMNRRQRGERLGLLELQTLWPFPSELVREKAKNARYVVVVEMNMGQVLHSVKSAVERPDKVFLANQVDGTLITPTTILNILRIIQGRGV